MIRVLAILLASQAGLFAFCIEPSMPYCVDSFGDFDDDYDFQTCKGGLESYLKDSNDYLQCIATKTKAKEVISKFNCKASGESYCY